MVSELNDEGCDEDRCRRYFGMDESDVSEIGTICVVIDYQNGQIVDKPCEVSQSLRSGAVDDDRRRLPSKILYRDAGDEVIFVLSDLLPLERPRIGGLYSASVAFKHRRKGELAPDAVSVRLPVSEYKKAGMILEEIEDIL